ncbi:MAG: 30S ribosome-binding factor RbfA [Christensenellales bacterium]|jgi:ribosome-binding factor A
MSQIRSDRINEEVKKAVSEVIRKDIKDPRLSPNCVVTKAEVTKDLKFAKIYVSVLGDEKERKDTMASLSNAAGYIRHRLGGLIDIRRLPQLTFKLDTSIEYGIHIANVIRSIKQRDEERE